MKTIKKISIAITLLLVSFCANAQNGKIDPNVTSYEKCYKKLSTMDLFYDIRESFIASWFFFRLQSNPYFSDVEKKRYYNTYKLFLPDSIYAKLYEEKVDIYRLEEMPQYKKNINDERYRRAALTQSPYVYVIEKKDGLNYYKEDFWSRKIIDSVQVNIYDSIYPYDNRFLVSYDGREMKCYSGNVYWDRAEYIDIGKVGYARGVQFGVEYVQKADTALNTKLRKLRPEHPEYVYATAEQSFLSRGKILIAGNPKTLSDYIEFIFYSDDPAKTGDQRGTYYEMRYVLPSKIESIKERRMIKRKLTEEEQHKLLTSYLGIYRDMTRQEKYELLLRTMAEQERIGTEEEEEEERLRKEELMKKEEEKKKEKEEVKNEK